MLGVGIFLFFCGVLSQSFGFWWAGMSFLFSVFLVFFFFFSFGWEELFLFMVVDSTSVLMVFLSVLITYLMFLASVRSYNTNFFSGYLSFFFFFLGLTLFLSFVSESFLIFFVFFEVSLLPTLMIILGWGYQPERLQASYYMMMYTVFSSLPLLSVILFWGVGNHSFSFFSYWLMSDVSVGNVAVGFLLFFSLFSFLVKLPVYGFHLWLPKAHVEAPVAGSMILAGVLLKLGGYGLYRVFLLYSFSFSGSSLFWLVVLMWGGVLASMVCLRQPDLKGLVAYSSVSHMAIMLCGYLVGNSLGVCGGLLMMVGHGLCSSCLFILASLGYDFFGSRSIFFVSGILCVCPSISFWWFLFSVGNMAAPFTLNLCSELFLFMSLLIKSYYLIFFLSMMSFLVAAYSLYFFLCPNHGSLLEGSSSFYSGSVLGHFVFWAHFFYLFFGVLFMDFYLF